MLGILSKSWAQHGQHEVHHLLNQEGSQTIGIKKIRDLGQNKVTMNLIIISFKKDIKQLFVFFIKKSEISIASINDSRNEEQKETMFL